MTALVDAARASYERAIMEASDKTDWRMVAETLAAALPKPRAAKRGRAPYRRWHVAWADGWSCVTGAYTWAETCPAEALAWAVARHALMASCWEPRYTVARVDDDFPAPVVPHGVECSTADLAWRRAERDRVTREAWQVRERAELASAGFAEAVGRVREASADVARWKASLGEPGAECRTKMGPREVQLTGMRWIVRRELEAAYAVAAE